MTLGRVFIKRSLWVIGIIALVFLAYYQYSSHQKQQVTQFWSVHQQNSTIIVDHAHWNQFLDEFVIEDEQSGINLVDYNDAADNQQLLKTYLKTLQTIDPRTLNFEEQKAYWINLYNALTVQLIIDHLPVKFILDLGETLNAIGPWDDQLITIADQPLSLNHIEHQILRPIWQDPRIHFAVNCASLGCPNLQIEAFTVENMEDLIEDATEAFIQHPRGVYFNNNRLILSSIFKWYAEDFGTSDEQLLQWLSDYADSDTEDRLLEYQGTIEYQYDWSLNGYED